MFRSALPSLIALAALSSLVLADDTPRTSEPTTGSPESEQQAPAPSAQRTDQHQPPRVIVHTGAPAADTRDSRVDLGNNMRISMSPWSSPPALPSAISSPAAPATPAGEGKLIEVPANTLGPGEPLWKIREREDAERKLAAAQAQYAQDKADYADREFAQREHNYRYIRFPIHHGRFYRHEDFLPRGPVTTTITRFNDLGSEAQRNFADAAYPRNQFEIDAARSRAILQFGRDAEPNIRDAQRARDEAVRNANRNTFLPPTTTEVVPQNAPK